MSLIDLETHIYWIPNLFPLTYPINQLMMIRVSLLEVSLTYIDGQWPEVLSRGD
jgi:hypothetical protein